MSKIALISSAVLTEGKASLCLFNCYFSLLQDGDFLQRYIGSQFVLQTIDFDELAVQFFLVLVESHETLSPFLLIAAVAVFHQVRIQTRFLTVALHPNEFIHLKVPRGFVSVPVKFGYSNTIIAFFMLIGFGYTI